MSPVRVKICGLRTGDAVMAAVRAGADWVGFVFHPRSPRFVTAEQAAALAAQIPPEVGCVGLLVHPDDATIDAVLDRVRLQALQVYADADRVRAIRKRTGVAVWHAIGVAARDDLPTGSGADRLVIEARPPPGADQPGGNGVPFDWTLLAGWEPPVAWMLAGGLGPDSVAEAVRRTGAPAVDVSSGVESSPGIKDPGLIRAFLRAAKAQ